MLEEGPSAPSCMCECRLPRAFAQISEGCQTLTTGGRRQTVAVPRTRPVAIPTVCRLASIS